ncbi:DNA mismatch repair protein MutS [Oxynema aestuarii]|jgi:DNA mismatch repair protein MutS|uniref:DNA mismatch repair protein MutS n=1 Tax=Oxynema aestuarii AP17 TaxID=2064643 RepID=A0A6H1TT58_9CYAN|nr:DNA mismatch repair protein MutS [Oxynema aestuarii]QIZ69784.1 DNA mismatch repair protein MutS [Oxynema aestuarii AP17]RMH77581.1 MAG: DNA mismatch repair protein MutS [Cyanobacteria bacterium J007]
MSAYSSASTPSDAAPLRTNLAEIRNADYREIDREQLSEMYRHYVEVKDRYPHAILLYRVGDFFETFFQDAITVARELELVLTSKQGGKIGRVPMTGVPHHALDRYAMQLMEKGYAIAVCDQVEDAAEAKGLVRREVTRVITPGTLLEEEMLPSRRNNFLAAVVVAKHHWGLAYTDISTGEFFTTQAQGIEHLAQELDRLQPSEVLIPTNAPDLTGTLLRPGEGSPHLPEGLPPSFCYSLRSNTVFLSSEARSRILIQFNLRSLEGLGCEHLPLAVRAAGGLLEYLEDTQKENSIPLQPVRTYTISDFLTIDRQTRSNLEIVQTVRDGTFHGSLLWALDKTVTAMGSRTLRRWLLQPLLQCKGIEARQDTIQELVENATLRESLQQQLRQIYDLERLTGRAGSGTANARDLVSLADSLGQLPQLAQLGAQGRSRYLKAVETVNPDLEQLGRQLRQYLVENPPLHLTEGGLIRSGVDTVLDEMKAQVEADQQWIANLEVTERERTGIANLKVGYNKTFGYYISIARSKSDRAPEDYVRRQTLTNEERYITPELKERESRILTARDDLNRREYELFTGLRSQVANFAEPIRKVARAVAALDVLCALAKIASERNYCRPQMVNGREIAIVDGRHPVVEVSINEGFFVPNSTRLGRSESSPSPDLIILTGPNASGKSCYLRQVGLIQLMAQTGSFVPATSARLGICDRIFTRVGAVDDLATGQSTFMVEMNETANILNHATSKSLVLLDEIGRGTATFDGLSIAWSVAEYLATEIQARTIFATHYHELNELASLLSNVANYQVTVKELPDRIIFLHQVQPGGADRSYGIEAGRLAGLPDVVIRRARQVMGQIEKHSKIAVGLRKGARHLDKQTVESEPVEQLDLLDF